MNSLNPSSVVSNSLLCVYYPQQLLPGLAAVLRFRRHFGDASDSPLTVLVWTHPSISDTAWHQRLQTFRLLLERFAWIKLYFPTQNEIQSHLSHNFRVAAKARYLKNKFGNDAFKAIYYAHDISADFIAQSAMKAFPRADRVCFGDGLGLFYSNDYFTKQTYPLTRTCAGDGWPLSAFRNWLFRIKRAWTLPFFDKATFGCQYVVPILPSDPGGDYLRGKQVMLVDNASITEVLNMLSEAAGQFVEGGHVADRRNAVVMLLGSYSESKLTTEDQELDLYTHAAQENIAKDQKIVLKPHPASSAEKTMRIQKALATAYTVEIADCNELPVEFIPTLVEFKKIISFSYSSVSLRYLYGIDVLHALTDDTIKTYFPVKSWAWMQSSNDLYLEQLTEVSGLNPAQTILLPSTIRHGQSALSGSTLK